MSRVSLRPLPGFTVFALVMLALLLALGTWQLERRQWKLGLIAQVDARMSLPPVSLGTALGLGAAGEYRHVRVTGRFDYAHESFVYALDGNGAPVYHLLTPLLLAGGKALLIDRGIIPQTSRDAAARASGNPAGPVTLTGVWRASSAPGWFTPPADSAKRVWFVRDVPAIARADGVHLIAPVVIEADAAPNPGGWPKGGQTVVMFRNEHLQYAITWYALALGLIGVYLAYHRAQGRLTW